MTNPTLIIDDPDLQIDPDPGLQVDPPGTSWSDPVQEQHPDLSNWARARVQNLTHANPKIALRDLQAAGFEAMEIAPFDFAIRKPGGKWYKVDPSGGGVGERLKDITDVAGGALTGTLGAIGGAIGMVTGAGATAPSGPGAIAGGLAGGAFGAGVGGAAGETVLGGLGRLAGVPYEGVGEQLRGVAEEGLINAAGEVLGQGIGYGFRAGRNALFGRKMASLGEQLGQPRIPAPSGAAAEAPLPAAPDILPQPRSAPEVAALERLAEDPTRGLGGDVPAGEDARVIREGPQLPGRTDVDLDAGRAGAGAEGRAALDATKEPLAVPPAPDAAPGIRPDEGIGGRGAGPADDLGRQADLERLAGGTQARLAQYATEEGLPIPQNAEWMRPQDIQVKPDEYQFRTGVDVKGVTEGRKIEGAWDPVQAGDLVVHERLDGTRYVANGHHRLEFAQRVGVPELTVRVFKEADGWTVPKIREYAALKNIIEGNGKWDDYLRFFREARIPENEAKRSGLLGRNTEAKAAWLLAQHGGEDLYASTLGGRISLAQAARVAGFAPGNDGLQRVALARVLKEPDLDPSDLVNYLRSVKSVAALTGRAPVTEQGDMFGMLGMGSGTEADEAHKAVQKGISAIQAELRTDINTIRGSAKNPEIAAKYKINVEDPMSVLAQLERLKAELASWETDQLTADQVRRAAARGGLASDATERTLRPDPSPPPPEVPDEAPGQTDLFAGLGGGRVQPGETRAAPPPQTPPAPPSAELEGAFRIARDEYEAGEAAYRALKTKAESAFTRAQKNPENAARQATAAKYRPLLEEATRKRQLAREKADEALRAWKFAEVTEAGGSADEIAPFLSQTGTPDRWTPGHRGAWEIFGLTVPATRAKSMAELVKEGIFIAPDEAKDLIFAHKGKTMKARWARRTEESTRGNSFNVGDIDEMEFELPARDSKFWEQFKGLPGTDWKAHVLQFVGGKGEIREGKPRSLPLDSIYQLDFGEGEVYEAALSRKKPVPKTAKTLIEEKPSVKPEIRPRETGGITQEDAGITKLAPGNDPALERQQALEQLAGERGRATPAQKRELTDAIDEYLEREDRGEIPGIPGRREGGGQSGGGKPLGREGVSQGVGGSSPSTSDLLPGLGPSIDPVFSGKTLNPQAAMESPQTLGGMESPPRSWMELEQTLAREKSLRELAGGAGAVEGSGPAGGVGDPTGGRGRTWLGRLADRAGAGPGGSQAGLEGLTWAPATSGSFGRSHEAARGLPEGALRAAILAGSALRRGGSPATALFRGAVGALTAGGGAPVATGAAAGYLVGGASGAAIGASTVAAAIGAIRSTRAIGRFLAESPERVAGLVKIAMGQAPTVAAALERVLIAAERGTTAYQAALFVTLQQPEVRKWLAGLGPASSP